MGAMGDFITTFIWNFLGAMVSDTTPKPIKARIVSLAVTNFPLIHVVDAIGTKLGDANYNPTTTVAFYAAGVNRDHLFSMALRLPAQVAGAVGGFMAVIKVMSVMPAKYKMEINGPILQVDANSGAFIEGFLTFWMTLVVLSIRRPTNKYFQTLMFTVATIVVFLLGEHCTGPSMNPTSAFGWAYVNDKHNPWEQFYVYSISPFIGAIGAGCFYRAFFPPPA